MVLFDALMSSVRFPIAAGWSQGMAITVMVSNVTIFLVHVTMAVFLLFFAFRKIQPRTDRRVLIGFASLFLCSGASYFARTLLFVWPVQMLVTAVSVITSLISVATFSIWLPLVLSQKDEIQQSNVETLMRRLEEMQADLMSREHRIDALLAEIANVPRLSRKPDAE